MKRALMISFMFFTGCEVGLADKQAELAAVQRDEQQLAQRLDALTSQMTGLKAQFEGESSRGRRLTVALRESQISAINKWRGKADLLAGMVAKHKMPKPLLDSLQQAQTAAGGESIENRFAEAVKADDFDQVPSLIDGWERHWLEEWDPAPAAEPAKVCPTNRTLSCTAIDDDALWCPDGEQRTAWAMLLENGALTVAQMQGGTKHVVEARLAPKVWLTRVGNVDDGMLVVSGIQGNFFTLRWNAEVKRGDKRLESLKANFDKDPYTEALFWLDEDLTIIDPVDKDSITILKNADACRALETTEGVPRVVKDTCLKAYAKQPQADAGTP